ncbi:ATP-dependent RNA helicase DHX29 [Pelomyxa schiedti]|nr:ATP-dependent RNA helicase DHX29 [Pelomyxa schiedti]
MRRGGKKSNKSHNKDLSLSRDTVQTILATATGSTTRSNVPVVKPAAIVPTKPTEDPSTDLVQVTSSTAASANAAVVGERIGNEILTFVAVDRLFTTLTTDIGFSEDDARDALANTLSTPLSGGAVPGGSSSSRLEVALDWLCLNVSPERMPPGFAPLLQADTSLEESSKCVVICPGAKPPPKEAQPPTSAVELTAKICTAIPVSAPAKEVTVNTKLSPAPAPKSASPPTVLPVKPSNKSPKPKQKKKSKPKQVSSWILNYAGNSSEEDSAATAVPDVTKLGLGELQEELAKEQAKKGSQKDVNRIRLLAAEIKNKRTETIPSASCVSQNNDSTNQPSSEINSPVVLTETSASHSVSVNDGTVHPNVEEAVLNLNSEVGDVGSLFEASSSEIPTSLSSSQDPEKNIPVEPLIPPSWTGKTPVQLLQDWCRKHKRESPKFLQDKVPPGIHRWSVVVENSNKHMETVSVNISYMTASSAKNAVATKALHLLASNEGMDAILPGYFRQMWLDMNNEKKEKIQEARNALLTHKAEYINAIIAAAKQKYAQQTSVATPKTTPTQVESWEDIITTAPDITTAASSTDTSTPIGSLAQQLYNQWAARQLLPAYQQFLPKRESLPIPQFILDDADANKRGDKCSIVCTQPRRISAISLAARISQERAEPRQASDECQPSVGYQVRFHSKHIKTARLLFVTTGILLRRLHASRDLAEFNYIIVDEVHERDIHTDFLISLIKGILSRRTDLKVILMSATINAKLFSTYFGGCPIVNIPGREHPVSELFLEDILEKTNFVVAADSPFARQTSRSLVRHGRIEVSGRSGNSQAVTWEDWEDNFGDAPTTLKCDNEAYSEQTALSLSRMDEDVINYDVISSLIWYIHRTNPLPMSREARSGVGGGGILVFLPGLAEITAMSDNLTEMTRQILREKSYKTNYSHQSEVFYVTMLHSTLSVDLQQQVFQHPPGGMRKVVLATNIAETSITIDDISYVIDTGRVKEFHYNNAKKMSCLITLWESRANAKQRAGRAGRVAPGICYRCFTKARYMAFSEVQKPEIQRTPLEELCLQIKLLDLGTIHAFLSNALEAPSAISIKHAIETLNDVGALDEQENLTPLGRHLAILPLDIHLGKMLVYACIFGCQQEVLTIAAIAASQSPFLTSPNSDDLASAKAKQLALFGSIKTAETTEGASARNLPFCGDLIMAMNAFNAWKQANEHGGARAANDLCRNAFLHLNRIKEIADLREQYHEVLHSLGFVGHDLSSPPPLTQRRLALLQAIICAGFYPRVVHLVQSDSQIKLLSKKEEVFIHPVSVAHGLLPAILPQSQWMVYFQKVKSSRIFIRDCTPVSPLALLLFGGTLAVQHLAGTATVDKWLVIHTHPQTAVAIKQLRNNLDAALTSQFANPSSAASSALVKAVTDLLSL